MHGRTIRILMALAMFVPAAAQADSWLPPKAETYTSLDGEWRVTIHPRRVGTARDDSRDDVDDVQPAAGEAPDTRAGPVAVVETRDGDTWRRAWQRPLRNDVAPTGAVVLPGGYLMTLDNWYSVGFGEDAVVLYDTRGDEVAAFALADFLGDAYVQALPRSVGSIWWRDEARALPDGRRVAIPVVVPRMGQGGGAPHIDVEFDVVRGTVERPDGPQWRAAVEAARMVRRQQASSATPLDASPRRIDPPAPRDQTPGMDTLPPITMSRLDQERLEAVLESADARHFPGLAGLEREMERATVVAPEAVPPDVVTMNSTIRFAEAATGQEFELTLVYPRDAGKPGTVSVLAPVGSALIGLSVGHSIKWPGPGGKPLDLRVLEVVRQPEAMGEFHR